MRPFFLAWAVSLLLLPAALMAQPKGKAEFITVTHDFGDIKEEGGKVLHQFRFTNKGAGMLALTEVNASCGCTTPSWSRDPIKPGEEGVVSAEYDPLYRPGRFDKAVTVYTNGEPEIIVLRITGNVLPREKGMADIYPMEMGNLRFKSTHIAFNDVLHDQPDTASTVVYNQGKQPITIFLDSTRLPAPMRFATLEKSIVVHPEETAALNFFYEPGKINDWGFVFDYFQLITDDADQPQKRMNVSANIRENFSTQPGNAPKPRIKVDKTSHNFGNVGQNQVVTTTFTIRNEGNAPLILRKTKASCGCTASKPRKTELAPGETTTMDVSYSAGTSSGVQKKSITLIANDPLQDVTTLWIEANVTGGR